MEVAGWDWNFGSSSKNSKVDVSAKEMEIQLRDFKEKIKSEESVKIIRDLMQQTEALARQDIKKWRDAYQAALDFENPQRVELYSLYKDAMLDLHLLGAVRNRKLAVLGKKFYIADKEGKKDPELTKLLQKRWFRQLLGHAMDSIFWGHSLIQFGDIIREPKLKFTKTMIVPRVHVCPEFQTVVKEVGGEGKKGTSYKENPYALWTLEFGESHELGMLNPLVKEVISKKFALQFWDQFAEIFGMPLRVAKTTSSDKKEHARIENMLEDMGSAAWALFPEGTTLEIKESTKGDAYNVYDKRVLRANSEISKAVLGQTMTMDDGASQSQAVVHEDVADSICDSDTQDVLEFCNEDLMPLLIIHGWPFTPDHQILIDDSHEFSPEEMKDIEEMLLGEYDVEPKYFIEKYNVPIIAKKSETTNPKTELAGTNGFFA